MSANSEEAVVSADGAVAEESLNPTAELRELKISDVVPNDANPRLDFPQDELDRLTGSIDQEGVLVPIVVYPRVTSTCSLTGNDATVVRGISGMIRSLPSLRRSAASAKSSNRCSTST